MHLKLFKCCRKFEDQIEKPKQRKENKPQEVIKPPFLNEAIYF
jgi:hypothetical protein